MIAITKEIQRPYMAIMNVLIKKKKGLNRNEIAGASVSLAYATNKKELGIGAVISSVQSWQRLADPDKKIKGAQIDFLIDRKDDVINICEIKFCSGEYIISAKDEISITNKIEAFKANTRTKKALHLKFITPDGLAYNLHSGIVQSQIVGRDLFSASN